MLEVSAVKVKLPPEESHVPAIAWAKIEASQVPRVSVREFVTVHPPVEVTVSVDADLLIVRLKKVKLSTLAAVLPLRVTVPVELNTPVVRVMLPATNSPFPPITSVPEVSARAPSAFVNPIAPPAFTVEVPTATVSPCTPAPPASTVEEKLTGAFAVATVTLPPRLTAPVKPSVEPAPAVL